MGAIGPLARSRRPLAGRLARHHSVRIDRPGVGHAGV